METKPISETKVAEQTAGKTTAQEKSSTLQQNKNKTNGSSQTLKSLLEHGLNDVYSAEQQLVKALPELAKHVHDEELQDAVLEHLDQTKKHVERLEKIFIKLKIEKTGESCKAMEGLIEETKKLFTEFEESPVRDSALIIAAQKVEHYEIASYGSLCELADVLGLGKVSEILGKTLDEEEQTDELLTEIAMDINDEAYEASESMSH